MFGFFWNVSITNVVPRFILDRIRTLEFFRGGDRRAESSRQRYGLEVLSRLARQEFRERGSLLHSVRENREAMFVYNKKDYLFVKQLKDDLVRKQKYESEKATITEGV